MLCLCQYVDVLKPERQARRGTRKALCGGGLRALAAWPRGSEAPALDPASMHFTSQLTLHLRSRASPPIEVSFSAKSLGLLKEKDAKIEEKK